MTSLSNSGQKPPLLLEYRPVGAGSFAMAESQPPAVPEPDWNDPLEVQAFSLMREGRSDEALALLHGEIGRARTRATGGGPAPLGAQPRSWDIAAPTLRAADVRPTARTAKSGPETPVARRDGSGSSEADSAWFAPAWAASRGPAMWAIGVASVTLAVLAGTLWPTTDLGATAAPGTLALESRPAAVPAAVVKAPAVKAAAVAAPAQTALAASPGSTGAKAADSDGWSTPAAGMARLQTPSAAAVASIPFTPKPRPETSATVGGPPVGDVASAQAQPKSTVTRQAQKPSAAATPRARNRAAALAYAQKRRVGAEKAAGRQQVPLIGDGAGYARSRAARYDREGPTILLGGHGLP